VHKPIKVASRHSLGRQELGDPVRVTSMDDRSQNEMIVTSHVAWEQGCAYMYKRTILFTTRFKVVIIMNLLELHS